MQTSADYRSRRRHVSRMTDEKGETWSHGAVTVTARWKFTINAGEILSYV